MLPARWGAGADHASGAAGRLGAQPARQGDVLLPRDLVGLLGPGRGSSRVRHLPAPGWTGQRCAGTPRGWEGGQRQCHLLQASPLLTPGALHQEPAPGVAAHSGGGGWSEWRSRCATLGELLDLLGSAPQ